MTLKLSITIIVYRQGFHFPDATKNISSYFRFLEKMSVMISMNATSGVPAINTKKPSTEWEGISGWVVLTLGRGVSTNFTINMSLYSLVVLSNAVKVGKSVDQVTPMIRQLPFSLVVIP